MATAAYDMASTLAPPRYRCYLATTRRDVEDSLRLRHRVFVQEMGAQLAGHNTGLERDEFDAHCRHLLVRDNLTKKLVASTRILTQERVASARQFYSAKEFDLTRVLAQPGRVMEIGRTCVHPEYRRGAVIATLWSGISDFTHRGGYQRLIGCASVELDQGFSRAHTIYQQLRAQHLSPAASRVTPRLALPPASTATGRVRLPPLLKAYINLGATIGGPPCWDPEFRVADLFMHLQIEDMCPRYVRHFNPQPRHRHTMSARA